MANSWLTAPDIMKWLLVLSMTLHSMKHMQPRGWSLTAPSHNLVKLARSPTSFSSRFPIEVHDILPNFGNFFYYFVEKGRVFLTNHYLFFFFSSWKWPLDFHVHYKLPQYWGSSQRDLLMLIIIGANCIGSSMTSPTTFCLVNELFKNHVFLKAPWSCEKRVGQQ